MSLMNMTLILFSQTKLCFFCQSILLRCKATFDFSWESIFFYVIAVPAERELPAKGYIDSLPPPVYKSRSVQMVAGLTLGLQQQQSFQSTPQHIINTEIYSSHEVPMFPHLEGQSVKVFKDFQLQQVLGYQLRSNIQS